MERTRYLRRNDRSERWLRLLRDGGIALVGVAALAGLARDLSASRGPVIAWIIVTLLGGAGGLFAWSLLEVRDARVRSSAATPRTPVSSVDEFPASGCDAGVGIPLMPAGLFPPARPASATSRRLRRRPRARLTPREQRMRTRRTPAGCAASRTRRPVARATRRLPHANI